MQLCHHIAENWPYRLWPNFVSHRGTCDSGDPPKAILIAPYKFHPQLVQRGLLIAPYKFHPQLVQRGPQHCCEAGYSNHPWPYICREVTHLGNS